MRRLILAAAGVLIGMGHVATTLGAWAPIYDVKIQPYPPLATDPLAISAHGEIGSTDWYVDHASFSLDGTEQVLDLFFHSSGIGLTVVVPWSHSEPIGTLPAETYSLTVRTHQFFGYDGYYHLADTYATSFTVFPEPPIPGDTNIDGNVDETDVQQTLVSHWGKSSGWLGGDFDGDGVIGAADAAILAANWGHRTSEATVTPEPSTFALLGMGVVGLLAGIRRRRQ